MLLLMLRAGEKPFGVDVRHVLEVVPRVALEGVPHAPAVVAGLLAYRGEVIPVVDLRRMLEGEPCEDTLATRILVLEYDAGFGERRRVGLVAENVTDVAVPWGDAPAETGLTNAEATWLGPVLLHQGGMIRLLKVEELLSEELRGVILESHLPGGQRGAFQ